MKILGAKVEKPVQWMTANVAGVTLSVYDLVDQPWGELPSYLTTLGWVYAGVVIVRVLALILLLAVPAEKEEVAR